VALGVPWSLGDPLPMMGLADDNGRLALGGDGFLECGVDLRLVVAVIEMTCQ